MEKQQQPYSYQVHDEMHPERSVWFTFEPGPYGPMLYVSKDEPDGEHPHGRSMASIGMEFFSGVIKVLVWDEQTHPEHPTWDCLVTNVEHWTHPEEE